VTGAHCTLAAVNVFLLLVLLTLAVARATRLLVADAFPPVARARSWVAARGDWQEYLTSCPWCMSVWVAGLVTLAADVHYGLPAPLLVWPASAYVAAWIVASETHDTEEN